MARRQLQDLPDAPAIRVPGAVTDLFGGAPRPVIDNDMGRLADALGAFNQSLTQFGAASARMQRLGNKGDQDAAQSWLLTHTQDEIKGAVKDGTIPIYSDPTANAAIAKGTARVYGGMIRSSINADIQTGKIDMTDPTLDIDKLITDHSKDALEYLGGKFDPQYHRFVTAGLSGELGPTREALVANHQKAMVNKSVQDRLTVFNQTLDGVINKHGATLPDGTVDPKDVQSALDELKATKTELGQSLAITGKSLPYKWMDDQLVSAIKNNVKTHPEIAVAALTEKRTDQNGNPLPALIDNPTYAKEAQQIITEAQTAMSGKLHDLVTNQHVNEAIKSLEKGDGSIFQGHDVSYFNKYTKKYDTIPWDTIKKQAIDRWQSASDLQSQQTNETPDAKFDREYNVYHQSNLPWPQVKNTLEGVASTMTNPAAMTNPQFATQAKAAGEMYMKLGAKDYNYLKSTVNLDKRSEAFYQTYDLARRYLGQNEDQAYSTASSVLNVPGGLTTGGVDSGKIQKAISDKLASDFSDTSNVHWYNPLSWLSSSSPANIGAIQRQVTSIATVYARVPGMKPEDAVTYAEQWVKDHSTVINGHVVTAQGYMPPKDLQQYVPQALAQFTKDHGAYTGVHDPANLSVMPFGQTGNFRIVDRSGSVPQPLFVLDKKGNATPAVVKMEDLLNARKNAGVSAQQKLDSSTIQTQNAHNAPTFSMTPTPQVKSMSDQTDKFIKSLGVSPETLDHYWGVAADKAQKLFGIGGQ